MRRIIIYHGLKALLVTLVLAVSGIAADSVHATTGGLTLSPTAIDTEVAPGASYHGEMLVLNQSDLETSYNVYATPYSVTGEEYKPYFSPVKGATDITKWFSFSNRGSTLNVGGQDKIPFTITVPRGMGAGSYFATVFVETKDKGTTGVVTRKRIGMIVYLRVSGNATQKGSVDQWSVPLFQQGPLRATAKIANTGSVHFQAKLHVTVSDIFGNQKFAYDHTPEILPQKLRSVPVAWQNGATFGLFKVGGEVTYLGRTETLPTRFVFIASTPMRLATISLLLLLVIAIVLLGRRRVASYKK